MTATAVTMRVVPTRYPPATPIAQHRSPTLRPELRGHRHQHQVSGDGATHTLQGLAGADYGRQAPLTEGAAAEVGPSVSDPDQERDRQQEGKAFLPGQPDCGHAAERQADRQGKTRPPHGRSSPAKRHGQQDQPGQADREKKPIHEDPWAEKWISNKGNREGQKESHCGSPGPDCEPQEASPLPEAEGQHTNTEDHEAADREPDRQGNEQPQ